MKDNLQGISFDRWLMRMKDIALLIGILGSWAWGAFMGIRFVDRMNQRLQSLEARVAELQGNQGKTR